MLGVAGHFDVVVVVVVAVPPPPLSLSPARVGVVRGVDPVTSSSVNRPPDGYLGQGDARPGKDAVNMP